MTAFHALAKTNESWLRRLFEKYPDYVQSDWTLLLRLPSWWSKQQWIAGLKVFVFWNARYRKEYVEALRANLVPRGSYVRLQAFLFSYVFLHSGTEKSSCLQTKYRCGILVGPSLRSWLSSLWRHRYCGSFQDVNSYYPRCSPIWFNCCSPQQHSPSPQRHFAGSALHC